MNYLIMQLCYFKYCRNVNSYHFPSDIDKARLADKRALPHNEGSDKYVLRQTHLCVSRWIYLPYVSLQKQQTRFWEFKSYNNVV